MNTNGPETLQEAIKYFADFENCWKFMVDLRWPDKVVRCPRCDSERVAWLETAHVWKCYGKHDHAKFSLKTGTIFEDSPIALDKWLPVAWMVVNCRNGVSSHEIARDFKITQKSAWFMLHRVRLAMQDKRTGGKIGGKGGDGVEVDETFIGGKVRNMHKSRKVQAQKDGRNLGNKVTVLGMLERGGKVRTKIVQDRQKATIQAIVKKNVKFGSDLYSDEHGMQWRMPGEYDSHEMVNHALEYARGNVHTNGIENFWSLLKRSLGGTYVSVEPFHLFRYLDEQAFRFNNRKDADEQPVSDSERFKAALSQIVGRRLTYKELIGKGAETAPAQAN
jgi:transposase-like protein